jgi:tRNA-2-methylthio-N6-dimethylallyladenosine synthase
MNERDSEAVKGLLLEHEFSLTPDMEMADVILLNTCSVRQHAEDRIFGRSGLLSDIKKRKPHTVVGIMGCMAQQHGSKFFNRIPSLDLVCGPGNLSEMPSLVKGALDGKRKITATHRLNDLNYSMDGIHYRTHTIKTHVNIMSGCDHKCTYCIVPFTRGIERSRPSVDVLEEVRGLVMRGFKDVMLLGQNVNCYGRKLKENTNFGDLLRLLDKKSGIERLRFITSHPKDAHIQMFQAMADCSSVCEHLHLPVQSGSSRILKRMKREHKMEDYLRTIEEYRRLVPEGSITTDFIVGFPGETLEDYHATRHLLKEVQFDSAFIFKYSPRPGTPALRLPDDVPEAEKHRRHQELLNLQRSISFDKNSRLLGKTVQVLFENKVTRKGITRLTGRTRQFLKVFVSCDENFIGHIKDVKVTGVLNESLLAEIK